MADEATDDEATDETWDEVCLFGPDEVAELRRMAAAEAERERLRLAGERLARRSRKQQGLSEYVEVQLWDTTNDEK